jgi:hypothetical protein
VLVAHEPGRARIRWTTQVCTVKLCQVASIASGKPDSHDQRVEVDYRVERLERSSLPGQDLLENLGGVIWEIVSWESSVPSVESADDARCHGPSSRRHRG